MANTSKKTESAPHTECDAPQLQESEFRERSATVVSLSQIKAPDGGWGYVILAGTSYLIVNTHLLNARLSLVHMPT